MDRFGICMIDLMTVLLLTVMALIAEESRQAKPIGVVEEAFVMVSGEVVAAQNNLQSAEWRDGDSSIVRLEGIRTTTELTPVERQSKKVFAALIFEPQPEAKVAFSAFRASTFAGPESSILAISASGAATVTCNIMGVDGKPSQWKFSFEEGGSHELVFTSKRSGNGVKTEVVHRELL